MAIRGVAISGSSDRVHGSAERLRQLGVAAWSHQADASTYQGLMAGEDMVVGGDQAAHKALQRHLTTPEPVKAAAHAKFVRPD